MLAIGRLIYVLWARQMRGYLRSGYRIAGSLAHPVLYLTSLGAGLGPIFRRAGEGDYFRFLSPGVVAMSILFAATFSGTDLLWERRFGVLKEAFVAPMPRIVFIFGRAVGSSTVALIHGVIVICICALACFRVTSPSGLPAALFVMLLIAMFFASVGLAIGCLMPDHSGFQLVMNFLILPMSFLSGAFYPLSNLPRLLYVAARLDPLSYGVDALRVTLIGSTPNHLLTDCLVLSCLTICGLAFAGYTFSRVKL
jgi:ABC-2 type transport system permease protein